MIFQDRQEAGRLLAEELIEYQDEEPIILALPRSGVPVAFPVAQKLKTPLDVLVVRKIGAPNNPEYGIGAIAENGVVVLDQRAVSLLGVSEEQLKQLKEKENAELERRVQKYRGGKILPPLKDRLVILVDDGLATGVTAQAAITAVKKEKPRAIIFAAPVCARDSVSKIKNKVKEIVCLHLPTDLRAIGQYYRHFEQTSDVEVIELLEASQVG